MFTTKNTKPNKDLIIHMLLLLFLGRIWLWPWVYQTACNVKQIDNAYKRTPAGQLLLFIFIPFYSLYWFYKTGKILSEYSYYNLGLPTRIGGLCCVVSIFSKTAASVIMQMESNKIEEAESNPPKKNNSHIPYSEKNSYYKPNNRQNDENPKSSDMKVCVEFINHRYGTNIYTTNFIEIKQKIESTDTTKNGFNTLKEKVREIDTSEEMLHVLKNHKAIWE